MKGGLAAGQTQAHSRFFSGFNKGNIYLQFQKLIEELVK